MVVDTSHPLVTTLYFFLIGFGYCACVYAVWYCSAKYKNIKKAGRNSTCVIKMYILACTSSVIGIVFLSLGIYSAYQHALLNSLDPSYVTIKDYRRVQSLEIYAALGITWVLFFLSISCQWLEEKETQNRENS